MLPATTDSRPSATAPAGGGLLSSSLASLAVHAAILVAAAVGLRGCGGQGQRGEADVEWKTVGLVTRTSDAAAEESTTPAAPAADATPASAALSSVDLAADDRPPVPLPEPPGGDLPRTLGPGSAAPAYGPAASEMDAGGPVASAPAAAPGLARGETSFLGIKDKGQSFVYVIDTSGSMGNHNALAVAKAELMASLEALDVEQKFQVVFYDEQPHLLRLPGTKRADYYTASRLNRTQARREIAAVQSAMGTRHLPALQTALALKPDVIFLLTDAADVTAKDLDAIARANAGRTRLHCVEFGLGPKLGRVSPLERLAAANGGAYQYRDVETFRR